MIKVFIEYKLEPDKMDEFLRLVHVAEERLAANGASRYRVFEGVDQPFLVVEEYRVEREEDYLRNKEERLNEQHLIWRKLNACVAGGKQKVHIWAFRELHPLR